MENKIRFGVWESIALVINTACARIFLNYPRQMIEDAGTAGWIETVYVSLLAFLGFMIIEKLYTKFAGKDLLDIGEKIGGSFGRVIVGMILLLLFLYIAPVILREYSENMKVIALTDSPISFVSAFFIVGMVVGAFSGIEAIVRFHAILVPIVIFALGFIALGTAPYYDLTNLFPILGNGMDVILTKGFLKLSLFAPMVYLFLISPFLKSHKNFKKVGYWGWGLSALFLTLSALTYMAVYSYPTALENFLPTYQLARLINYGRFFQRVESVFMLSWAASALMYLSALLFFTSYIFKKTFKLEYHRPLIIPFAILVFSISLLPPNLMTAVNLETIYYSYFAVSITFILPILLLLLGRGSKRGSKKGEEKT